MAASLVGQQLGEYVLDAEIGRGSMGAVYRAHHVRDGATYAIKVLLDALSTDASFITRFVREARVIAALHHPNIVRIYDVGGRQGSAIYFVMEHVEGVTLARVLRERKRLPAPQVVEVAGQAADALAYAHATARVVHRDIKPENLLVDRWMRVKLLDFGLARIPGTNSITQAGTVVGSLYYVAPEQLLGQPLDGRADIYALGVSMYEMLTGQRPYTGQTLADMSDAILTATAVPPSLIEPAIPVALEAVVTRAMARALAERYADAAQLASDLRALRPLLADAAAGTRGTRARPASRARAARTVGASPLSGSLLRPASLQPLPAEARIPQRGLGPAGEQ